MEKKERKDSIISKEEDSDATSLEEDDISQTSEEEIIEEIFNETDLPDNKIGFDDLDELKEEAKKEISNDYNFNVLNRTELHNMFKSKVSQCDQHFNLAQFDNSIFSTALQQNQYSVDKTIKFLEHRIFGFLEDRVKKETIEDIEMEGYCNVCFSEIKEEDSIDFGCKHILCFECMDEYLEFKINQGPESLRARCPYDGCKFEVTSDVIIKVCDKPTYKK